MYLPEAIKKVVGELPYSVDDIGKSEDTVLVFEDRYILKISPDPDRIRREAERFDWLGTRIPGAKSICTLAENGRAYYLRTLVRGESLISGRFLKDPELLLAVLAEAVDVLRSLDGAGCPFRSSDSEGEDFVHGDLCLPNIYADEAGHFAGFIDLENSGLGDRWYDYSWMLWSLQYNLKTDRYNGALLKKLGLEPRPDKYEQYIPEEYR